MDHLGQHYFASLLEMQNISPDPRPTASEYLHFNKISRRYVKIWEALLQMWSAAQNKWVLPSVEPLKKLSAKNRLLKETLQTSGKTECSSNNQYNGFRFSAVVS